MRRRLSTIAACMCAVLFVSSGLHARADATADATIRANYKIIQAASTNVDATPVAPLLTADFIQRSPDGSTADAGLYLRQIADTSSGVTLQSIDIAVGSLKVSGTSATAETTQTAIGTYTVGGIAKAIRQVLTSTDLWSLQGGTWKMQRSTLHSIVATMDGKIVQNLREEIAPSALALRAIRTAAVRIPTLRLGADPDQLAPIGAAIGAARIVGMGEGTHGTSEFFAFKDRLFKYLVEKKGFTVFGIEAYWGAGLLVDRYIKTGRGTAKEAVSALDFWTWNSPEMVDLVQWMHDYNAKPGKHPILSFVGFDMQDDLGAIGFLGSYLRAHDSAYGSSSRPALACAAGIRSTATAVAATTCRTMVAAIGTRPSMQADGAAGVTARQALAIVLQYLDFTALGQSSVGLRDRDMATNAEWIAQTGYPNAKVALWAHNGHLGVTKELSYTTMGTYLRTRFGRAYYAIGQTFGSGTVRALALSGAKNAGMKAIPVAARPNDTIAALFAPVGGPAFLDLRGLAPASALGSWFATPHRIAEIGATLDPDNPFQQLLPMVVPDSFDGLVYVPTSTAATWGAPWSAMHRDLSFGADRWTVSGTGFAHVDVGSAGSVAHLENRDGLTSTITGLAKSFDASAYRGTSVRVTAEIRTTDLVGFENLSASSLDAKGHVLLQQTSAFVSPAEHAGWETVEATVMVPSNATTVSAGVEMAGTGMVEIRNIAIAGPPSATEVTMLPDTWSLTSPAMTSYAVTDTPAGGWNNGGAIGISGKDAGGTFGSYAQKLALAPYLGKTIRISGMLRTEAADQGAFWLRIDSPGHPSAAFDNMSDRPLRGTQPWTPFSIIVHVPADASSAVTGLLLAGNGKLFGSDLQIGIVPDSTPATGT